jgi:hypothetical protein
MPPNCTTAQGNRLPLCAHHTTASGPASNTAPAVAPPARALTRPAAASPSRPAKGSTMPKRSHSKPASCGCQWYKVDPDRRAQQPDKKEGGQGARCGIEHALRHAAQRNQAPQAQRWQTAGCSAHPARRECPTVPAGRQTRAGVRWQAAPARTMPAPAAQPCRAASPFQRVTGSGGTGCAGRACLKGIQIRSWSSHPSVVDAPQCVQHTPLHHQKVAPAVTDGTRSIDNRYP